MASDYRWISESAQASAIESDADGQRFPTQAEAEAWLGDEWPALVQEGVAAVTLMCGGDRVYGPMSLSS
ncbi:MAG: hypothetical protein WBG36_07560 [Ornithinimicrobium sp.]